MMVAMEIVTTFTNEYNLALNFYAFEVYQKVMHKNSAGGHDLMLQSIIVDQYESLLNS